MGSDDSAALLQRRARQQALRPGIDAPDSPFVEAVQFGR